MQKLVSRMRGQAGRTRDNYSKAFEFARRFAPQVIYAYALGNDRWFADLARELSIQLDIPYVIHMMDDWPERLRYEQPFHGNVKETKVLDEWWKKLFDGAGRCLGISEAMSKKYMREYNREFHPISNAIDFKSWAALKQDYQSGKPFVVRYLGAVSDEKEISSLRQFARGLRELRRQGRDVILEIHTSARWQRNVQEQLGDLVVCDAIDSQKSFDYETLSSWLAEADLLLLALNFDLASQRYLGVSIQNKVPEYMASGAPVLVFGPKGNPSIEYARNEGWAYVVDQPNNERVESAVIELMDCATLRSTLGRRGRKIAIENHDLSRTQKRFCQILEEAVRDH